MDPPAPRHCLWGPPRAGLPAPCHPKCPLPGAVTGVGSDDQTPWKTETLVGSGTIKSGALHVTDAPWGGVELGGEAQFHLLPDRQHCSLPGPEWWTPPSCHGLTLQQALGSGLSSICSWRAVCCEVKGETTGSEFPLPLCGWGPGCWHTALYSKSA